MAYLSRYLVYVALIVMGIACASPRLSTVAVEEAVELQRVAKHIDRYKAALRYRMAVFEEAMKQSQGQDYERQPIQKINVTYEDQEQVITLFNLRLNRDMAPQVRMQLREEWQRSADAMKVLENVATRG